MMCNLCKGSGSLVSLSPMQWWDCPKCSGRGAITQLGPAEIRTNSSGINRSVANQTFKISELEPNETTLAHVMAKAGLFKSISEARKNGWDRAVEPGDFPFKKKQVTISIVL